ncbi:MAG: hypothetical protein M1823_003376 [Watsoniomyces obsoletus]|nr:MAG: hypothetical protein M1823_003376 [Watsoniomyces obsoletus]
MVNVFAVPVFFVLFRETLEAAVIVSVLLAFLKQTLHPSGDVAMYKRLRKQIWWGTGIGLFICTAIGGGMIGAFYGLKRNSWAGSELVWEGAFSLVAAVIITLMGAALLRVSKMRGKWRTKLGKLFDVSHETKESRLKRWTKRYAMFLLPFFTVLREGVEAIIFIGGVSLGQPGSAIPLAVIAGIAAGTLIGFLIYKGGNYTSIQIFLIVSTCFLYLVAAGLVSKAVWMFEADKWNKVSGGDAAENGAGPGSYDIRQSVFHVNCCSPDVAGGGGWGVFNSLFGWTNSATYGSVITYNLYWLVVIVGFLFMGYKEKKGRGPMVNDTTHSSTDDGRTSSQEDVGSEDQIRVEATK